MNRHVSRVTLFLGVSLFVACAAQADWQSLGGLLRENPDLYTINLALDGTTPYVSWREMGYGYTIMLMRYPGAVWEDFSPGITHAEEPALVFSGGTPWMAWKQNNLAYAGFYNGLNWEAKGNSLNVVENEGYFLRLAFSGATPYVAWLEVNNPFFHQDKVYAKYYNGSDWELLGSYLNFDPARDARGLSLALAGTTPYVAWSESTGGSAFHLYCRYYSGGAWQWAGGILNQDSSRIASLPSLAVSGTTPYLAWQEDNGSTGRILAARYESGSWQPLGAAANRNVGDDAEGPSLVLRNNTPYVAWSEDNGNGYQLYVSGYYGGGWQALGGSLNENPLHSVGAQPSLAGSADGLYVAWGEFNGTANEMYAKQYPILSASPTPVASSSSVVIPRDFSFRITTQVVKVSAGAKERFVLGIGEAGTVRISVYSLSGHRWFVYAAELPAGEHTVEWAGGEAGSGLYLAVGESGRWRQTEKFILVR